MTQQSDKQGHTEPTKFTIEANAAVKNALPLDDPQDFEDARRGRIAGDQKLTVERSNGNMAWDMTAYEFIEGEAPTSVNPSLWRQAKLNNICGLFEVTKGVYQVRGYDLSNLTIIEGKTGWIVVDPMITMETTAAAFELAKKHLDAKPVVAVIHTHSHIDHFGGVMSIVTPEEASAGAIRIVAPQGFIEEAVSETLTAGIAMARRAQYMYGRGLASSERGHVDTGLGKGTAAGSIGILQPTDIVDRTPQEMEIDGLRFVFQNAPESEAPAELTFYLPDIKAYCGAEIVSRTMHNVYTLRGTKARDALKWSNYIDEAIDLFGDAEIYFGTHHWPVWDNDRVIGFLKKQRDIYKYIHDQTLRMANEGYTPREISEKMTFPEALRTTFSVRGYYGTLQHNAKAVYTYYFGWYNGNPASLNPLPPVESGTRYVKYMGGADAILARARESFDEGDYRWVAEVLNHLVFAEPENEKAKTLLAQTYDQLGYQSESGPWRDVYLTAAYELRHGTPAGETDLGNASDMIRQIPVSKFFDTMAVRLKGPEADGKNITINITFTDRLENHVLKLENAVLHHKRADPDPEAAATLKLTHELYLRIFTGKAKMAEAAAAGDLVLEGDANELIQFFALFGKPQGFFNIVTP
ncbi:MAG: MBL fold metallo-hydrolase [Proteobacteria bacterium]|nr:MBL fold metallo-hydrolase [Pseudomonadota bacterium]